MHIAQIRPFAVAAALLIAVAGLSTSPRAAQASREGAMFVSAVPESPLPPTGTTEGLLLNLLGGAVLVPIGEEILFRDVATTAWRRVYGSLRAVVQGGLFFAIVHVMLVAGAATDEAFALAIVAFAGRIPVAFALGWLFESRRSIWAPIGLHAAYNGVLITLAHLALTAPAT